MKERVEDLGRLSVKIQNIINDDLWEIPQGNEHTFLTWFCKLSKEAQEEILKSLVVGINRNYKELLSCLDVANGKDDDF